jgi:hypothetical protein
VCCSFAAAIWAWISLADEAEEALPCAVASMPAATAHNARSGVSSAVGQLTGTAAQNGGSGSPGARTGLVTDGDPGAELPGTAVITPTVMTVGSPTPLASATGLPRTLARRHERASLGLAIMNKHATRLGLAGVDRSGWNGSRESE